MTVDDLTTRFSGETPYQAIVNHWSLDIEDEQAFQDWMTARGHNPDALDLEHLELLFDEWKKQARQN